MPTNTALHNLVRLWRERAASAEENMKATNVKGLQYFTAQTEKYAYTMAADELSDMLERQDAAA